MHIIWLLLHFFLDILHHVFALSALFCTILYLFIAMNAIIVIIARSKKKSRRNWHSPTTTNDDNHKIPAPHAYSAAKWRGIQIFFFLALYLCNYCYPLTLGTCFKLFREFCRRILSFNGLEYSCRFTTILQSWRFHLGVNLDIVLKTVLLFFLQKLLTICWQNANWQIVDCLVHTK